MQQTSALYRRIIADENHFFQTRVVIGESGNLITEGGEKILFGGISIIVARTGPDSGFPENYIFSVNTSSNMLQNKLEIGRCISQEIVVQMVNPSGDMPRMSAVVPYVRACTATEQSEWIQQGVFYIDTRTISDNDEDEKILELHGYDAMLFANDAYSESNLDWPAKDTDVVQEIAGLMGVGVDERTFEIMDSEYTIPYPGTYMLIDVLSYIASMYLGSFIITETGDLRLVSILELPKETRYLIDKIGDVITFGGDRILV